MAKKGNSSRRDKLRKHAAREHISYEMKPEEAMHLGLKEPAREKAYVALKYFDPKHQCFSNWDATELSAFSQFVVKLNQQTWTQVYKSAGSKGDKVGLGYSPHKDPSVLPGFDRFSEDITFFELRVTKKARVHGFRVQSAFFLICLDKDHAIYPGK